MNNIETMAKDRKVWITLINRRMRFIADWEEKMAFTMRTETKPERSQRRNEEELKCRWEGCDKVCRTKGGFFEKHNLTNHLKSCRGGVRTCPGCGKYLSSKYLLRA